MSPTDPTAVRNKKLLQVVVSLVLTLLFVNFYLKSKEQNIENSFDIVTVLASSRDIPPHTAIYPGLLTTKRVPLKYMEPGAIMLKIPGDAYKAVAGKISVPAIPAGAQIVQSNLTDPSPKTTGVSVVVPPGKRGFLLRLGNMDVAELILPGNHIDILGTFTVRDKDATSRITYTILQNVLVIGVGRDIKKPQEDVTGKKEDSGGGMVLTLALDPMEAQRLSLAQIESGGELSVVVRPHGEEDILQIPGVTAVNLLESPRYNNAPPPTTNPAPAR